VYLLILVKYIEAECDVCQRNRVACINSTSYYLCFEDNFPNTEVLYHCKDGFDCTNLNAICVQSNVQRPPSCDDSAQCGLCSAHRNYVFACQSRTTFQMCYGAARPTSPIGYCPDGYVCDATSDSICVPESLAASVTCGRVATDTTTSTTTTTTTETTTSEASTTETTTKLPNTPQYACEQVRQVGVFPTQPSDPFCKRYVYCYYVNGVIKGTEYTCSSGSYFDIQDSYCTLFKPSYCL
ncbi:uncharacterized protein LOC119679376, partial [Teleopsis dalmanni]|uniref:uncharacterized protein LOC119679376 n=1 Tax=Teleopsis dalmanni TaxID=139649 RepID=UPI0018CE442B